MISAVLASCASLLTGLVVGAAIQRWADADRATEHHTKYPAPRAPEPGQEMCPEPGCTLPAHPETAIHYGYAPRGARVYLDDWGQLH